MFEFLSKPDEQNFCAGKTRARDAALAALSSPLLDIGVERATGIVWNITGPPDMSLFEVRVSLKGKLKLDRNKVLSFYVSYHSGE